MVETSIGILAIQGAVSEHVAIMKQAFIQSDISGNVISVREKKDIDTINGLIIPGGESTTISKMMKKSGLFEVIGEKIQSKDISILGTCAGCILLGKEVISSSEEIPLIGAMDMEVQRNAFGRQRESFEQNIDFNNFKETYPAVFIRAPVIKRVWGDCKVLAKIDKKIIAARQESFLALSFHPELSRDLRIHQYFIEMVV